MIIKNKIKRIPSSLNELYPDLELDTIGLAYLTDFYFDARYPGDDFSVVTEQEFQKCLSIMYDTVNKLKTLKL